MKFVTIDTLTEHYWNYKIAPQKQDKSWGDSVYTDYSDFNQASLKIRAINMICGACSISLEDITAFGDDFADIGMLKQCGLGIAMGNAIDEVKKIADIVIGRNDEEGIAEYMEKEFLK